MRLSLLSVVALTGCVVGCNKSPEGGTTPNAPHTGFKLSLPLSATTKDVKQGDTATFDASIDRDSEFKKDVKLSATAVDSKVSVKLSKDAIKASDDTKFTITVTPAKDAPLGETVIRVTGNAGQRREPHHRRVQGEGDREQVSDRPIETLGDPPRRYSTGGLSPVRPEEQSDERHR